MVEVAGRRRLVETKVCRVSLFSLLEYISYLPLMNFWEMFFEQNYHIVETSLISVEIWSYSTGV